MDYQIRLWQMDLYDWEDNYTLTEEEIDFWDEFDSSEE